MRRSGDLFLVMALWFFAAAIEVSPAQVPDRSRATADATGSERQRVLKAQALVLNACARLEDPATRMGAISILAQFSAIKLYQVGSLYFLDPNPGINPLQEQAVKAIQRHTNFATVSQALDSSDRALQYWGIWFWHQGVFEARRSEPNIWMTLIAKVKRLAADGDTRVRDLAVGSLLLYPQGQAYLAERLKSETDPDIVLTILNINERSERSRRFGPYFLRLLNHPYNEVRRRGLGFVGWNRFSAPWRQVDFDQSIINKILAMTKTKAPDESKAAWTALKEMKKW